MATIRLILIKGSRLYDITDLITQVKWGGRKGSAARYVEMTLLDDENRSARAGIKPEEGHHCIFYCNGKERFRGIIMRTNQSDKKALSFKAYDNGIYLANNKDTFNYSGKTMTYVFKNICKRFGIPYSACAISTYKIPELTKPKTTAWDVLCDGMSQVYKAKGIRHYIDSQKGRLRFLTRRDNIIQLVIEPGHNLISYSSSVSTEKVKTRVKLLSKDGKTLALKKNSALEKKIGIMQEVEQSDDSLSAAQLKKLVDSILKEQGSPERSLKVELLGNPDIISGLGVFVIIPALGIRRTYYVDEDTHTFVGNQHKMSLTLNLAKDVEYDTSYKPKGKSKTSGSTSGSDINYESKLGTRLANFNNTSIYNSANGIVGQCVWYVFCRSIEKCGKNTGIYGNANTWWYSARAKGMKTSSVPVTNSIACFNGGSYGHVIFVESVSGNTVYYTEANNPCNNVVDSGDGVLKKESISYFTSRSGYQGCIVL